MPDSVDYRFIDLRLTKPYSDPSSLYSLHGTDHMDFQELHNALKTLNDNLLQQATASVNTCLTLRNWLFGLYIHEYKACGEDRAKYGAKTLKLLSERLMDAGVSSVSERNLTIYRRFYQNYPEISQTASAKLKVINNHGVTIPQTLSAKLEVDQSSELPRLSGDALVTSLAFSHFVELIQIDDSLKRRFYEIECIKNHWAVRELRRQIASLYYERCGLSKDKAKLAKLANQHIMTNDPQSVIKDPYIFEFLGVRPEQVLDESTLSQALLDKLQQFLLELGKGFCFEARQKRILIGDEYFFIDLVFYHRMLRSNILIEIKVGEFNHQHIGQLSTYLNYYKKHEMHENDNPPIGILLCTKKNEALVEYAISDSDNQLFVSNYKLALPSETEVKHFIEEQLIKDLSHLIDDNQK